LQNSQPVNCDTAPAYASSLDYYGAALGERRAEIFLASKTGFFARTLESVHYPKPQLPLSASNHPHGFEFLEHRDVMLTQKDGLARCTFRDGQLYVSLSMSQ
jgi:hypothetical protein